MTGSAHRVKESRDGRRFTTDILYLGGVQGRMVAEVELHRKLTDDGKRACDERRLTTDYTQEGSRGG